jgi:hypothetical protein
MLDLKVDILLRVWQKNEGKDENINHTESIGILRVFASMLVQLSAWAARLDKSSEIS